MVQGGARTGGGRKPDPNALRRDRKDDAAWTLLPREGRIGGLPLWPLDTQSMREKELWAYHWKMPQAILWEQRRMFLQVALFCRTWAQAEAPDAPVAIRTLARQQSDGLLLTIPAMLTARVKIVDDEVADRRTERVTDDAPTPSLRDRLKSANRETA